MKAINNKNSMLGGLLGLLGVIVLVSVIGFFAAKPEPLILQGEVEANEYRVSGKIPGRVKEILVEEGMLVTWCNQDMPPDDRVIVFRFFDGHFADTVQTFGKGRGKVFRHMLDNYNTGGVFRQHLQKDGKRLGSAG